MELTAFHDAHRLNFVKYARSRNVQSADAEDVVSAAFLTLYRAGQAFLAADNRTAFAFKVLSDTIIDHFRRRDRRPRTQALAGEPDDYCGGGTGDGGIESVICRVDVERALQALPARQADCLRLRLFLELSREQIARYLGISPSAVSSHISAGRRALAGRLESYQPHVTAGQGGTK
ncbi:sigma-70 family RNA polymerase sigma factor [Streptomyces sp. NPDC013457]|uniref:sigma-70 family RNA polymerase sigma factor n=1 Tax=Streptomyces sp. NPDC013457 TaxID=3364866 RepID=UPI0036FB335A